jgi:AcrR family transcriptional regulator
MAADTRDRLIAAAFAVVARDGLEAASVKTIAAHAGVTPGLTHYHFPTKDALLEAALRSALDGYLARVRRRRETTAPSGQIAAFFDDARAAITTDEDFFRARLAFAARALTHPQFAAVMRELNAAAIAEAALTFAAAAGRSGASRRDEALAAMLKAAFEGLMLTWLTDPAFPILEAGAMLERTAADWVGGA